MGKNLDFVERNQFASKNKFIRYYYIHYLKHYTRSLRLLENGAWTDADPFKLIYINPHDIKYKVSFNEHNNKRLVYNKTFLDWHKNIGKVVDGDWDTMKIEFEANLVAQMINEKYIDGKEWEETKAFKIFETLIKSGHPSWHDCLSREDMQKRCRYLDELYEAIRTEGYKLSHRTRANKMDEVAVNIDRNGNFLYNHDGAHRLSIAKILNIDKIPVRVLVRHKLWQDIRDEFLKAKKIDDIKSKLRAYIHHPDMGDIIPQKRKNISASNEIVHNG